MPTACLSPGRPLSSPRPRRVRREKHQPAGDSSEHQHRGPQHQSPQPVAVCLRPEDRAGRSPGEEPGRAGPAAEPTRSLGRGAARGLPHAVLERPGRPVSPRRVPRSHARPRPSLAAGVRVLAPSAGPLPPHAALPGLGGRIERPACFPGPPPGPCLTRVFFLSPSRPCESRRARRGWRGAAGAEGLTLQPRAACGGRPARAGPSEQERSPLAAPVVLPRVRACSQTG